MSQKAESAYRAASWSAAGAAAAVSWLRGFDAGLFVSGTMAVIGVVVWTYTRVKLARSETSNKIWAEKRQLERDDKYDEAEAQRKDKLAEAAAEREIEEKATELKERTFKIDQRIKVSQERSEAKSLTAKVKELQQKAADQAHTIDQHQVESARRDNYDIERDRQLREALATIEALKERLARVEGKADRVEVKADTNTRKLEAIEQSQPAARDGDGAAAG